MNQDLQALMSRVARLGQMSEVEAKRIVNEVYRDGIVSRGEAEALFRLNDKLSEVAPKWANRFREAVADYLLTREPPQGWVTEEEASWLIAQVDHHGNRPTLDEIDLMIHVLQIADGAHESLFHHALQTLSRRIIADGSVQADMVRRMRFLVFARAGEGASWVSRTEASILFATNDAIAFAKNDPSWNHFFARAIANHLMARAHPNPVSETEALRREVWLKDTSSNSLGLFRRMVMSFDGDWFRNVSHSAERAAAARMAAAVAAQAAAEKITEDESAWFLERLGRDETISPAEKSLLDFLKAEAPGFVQGLAAAA